MPPPRSRLARARGPEAYLDAVLSIWAERHVTSTSVLTGNSMAPVLRHGDRVVIEHGNDALRIGDVVVYARDGRIVAHRFVRRVRSRDGERRLLVKGDRSGFWDPAIRKDEVLGRVVAVRGPTGERRLTSPFWAVANFLLAGCSRLRVAFARARRATRRIGRSRVGSHRSPEDGAR